MTSVAVQDFQHGGFGVVRSGVRARAMYGRQFVTYRLRETHCGRFVNVAITPVWKRYDIPDFLRDKNRELERTAQRAKDRVRQRVMTLGADRMITLTYRANVEDYEKARRDFRKFVARLRRIYKAWKFVAVAEQQERGAWHWHVAVKGYQHWNTLRSEWRLVTGEDGGNIDDNYKKHGHRHRSAAKIAGYISKYMGKGFDVEDKPHYRHLYLSSRGLCAHSMVHMLIGFDCAQLQDVCRDVLTARGKPVVTRYIKDDGYERCGARSW